MPRSSYSSQLYHLNNTLWAVQTIQLFITSFQTFTIRYIILPPTPTSSKLSPSFVFPQQYPVHSSLPPHVYYMPCPYHCPGSEQPTLGEGRVMSASLCSSLLCSSLQSPVTPQYPPQPPAQEHPQRVCVLTAIRGTDFHAEIKHQVTLWRCVP